MKTSGLENLWILECQQGSSNSSTFLLVGVGVAARVGVRERRSLIEMGKLRPSQDMEKPDCTPVTVSACCQGTRWAARHADHISALMSRPELAGPLGPPEWGRLGAHGGGKEGEPAEWLRKQKWWVG